MNQRLLILLIEDITISHPESSLLRLLTDTFADPKFKSQRIMARLQIYDIFSGGRERCIKQQF